MRYWAVIVAFVLGVSATVIALSLLKIVTYFELLNIITLAMEGKT